MTTIIITSIPLLLQVQLPLGTGDAPHYNPEELLGVVPENNAIPFDIREVSMRSCRWEYYYSGGGNGSGGEWLALSFDPQPSPWTSTRRVGRECLSRSFRIECAPSTTGDREGGGWIALPRVQAPIRSSC